MDGILINNDCLIEWVNEFVQSEQKEIDKHIDDILGFTIHKAEWIKTAIQIYRTITAVDSDIRAFALIRQRVKNKQIYEVNTSQLKGIMMPPTIILYKEHQNSVLFEDCLYSASISKQFHLPAYVHYDYEGECDVYLGGDQCDQVTVL